MASTDAKPIPQKNVAYRVTFPIYDADGDLVTGATGLDSEISKDGGTFADCTNEATEIATSSGIYYLDLTSTEMNADTVAVIIKTTSSGAKTTPIIMYPEEAGDIRVNVTQFGGTNGTFASGRPEVNTTHAAGTAWNSGAIGAATLATDTITAAKIAANAITSSELADGTITAAKFGTGAITATVIAADAIGASELAADAVTEIAAGVWANATRTLSALDEDSTTIDIDASVRAAVGLASANLDTQIADLPTNAELTAALASSDDAVLNAVATVDGNVTAIKAKTDSLTFTVAGQLDSNIQYVNDVEVTGVGTAGNPWGPA